MSLILITVTVLIAYETSLAALSSAKTEVVVRSNFPGFRVISLADGQVHWEQRRVAYAIEDACKALVTAGLPEYFADYLRTGGTIQPPV